MAFQALKGGGHSSGTKVEMVDLGCAALCLRRITVKNAHVNMIRHIHVHYTVITVRNHDWPSWSCNITQGKILRSFQRHMGSHSNLVHHTFAHLHQPPQLLSGCNIGTMLFHRLGANQPLDAKRDCSCCRFHASKQHSSIPWLKRQGPPVVTRTCQKHIYRL